MSTDSTTGAAASKGVLSKLEKNLEAYVGVALLLLYTAFIFYNVVSRFVTGNIIDGYLEISMGIFTWAVWLSASFAIRRRSHLRFTLARERVSQRINYILYVFEWVLWVILVGVILRFSVTVLTDEIAQGAEISTTGIPSYLFYLAIPVGTGLMIVRVLQQAIIVTREYRAGQDIRPDPSML